MDCEGCTTNKPFLSNNSQTYYPGHVNHTAESAIGTFTGLLSTDELFKENPEDANDKVEMNFLLVSKALFKQELTWNTGMLSIGFPKKKTGENFLDSLAAADKIEEKIMTFSLPHRTRGTPARAFVYFGSVKPLKDHEIHY